MDVEERILGCIFGGAVGDAFGYPIEFASLREIIDHHGPAGRIRPDDELIVSDDTQMTLFTIEGLVAAHREDADPDGELIRVCVHDAYLRWAHTQGEMVSVDTTWGLCVDPTLCVRRAPGRTCLSTLRSGVPGDISDPINDSKGCGGVMRVAPAGLLTAWSIRRAYEVGCDLAALTHGHETGWSAAGAFSSILRGLLDGMSLRDAVQITRDLLGESHATEVMVAMDAAWDATSIQQLGEGWVAEEALAMALFASMQADSFEELVRIAANHGGDSDSTASLAAQLYGTQHGMSVIDPDWIDRIDIIESLDRMASRLVDLN